MWAKWPEAGGIADGDGVVRDRLDIWGRFAFDVERSLAIPDVRSTGSTGGAPPSAAPSDASIALARARSLLAAARAPDGPAAALPRRRAARVAHRVHCYATYIKCT